MSDDKLFKVLRDWEQERAKAEHTFGYADATRMIRERFIVIDRDDLKADVSRTRKILFAAVHHRSGFAGGAQADILSPSAPNLNPEWHEATAFAHLAMAEYLRANPPVDEKAVKELAAALDDIVPWDTNQQRDDVARRLVAEGWKREVTS